MKQVNFSAVGLILWKNLTFTQQEQELELRVL